MARENLEADMELSKVIGANIRRKRRLAELSMEGLAHEMGCTQQQINKYEQGLNRISAPTLYRLSQFFGVPTDSFFEEKK